MVPHWPSFPGALTEDMNIWSMPRTLSQDPTTWPSVLLTILWRLWDTKNGTIFRSEKYTARQVISRVSDDLATWEKRFAAADMVPGLRRWSCFLRSRMCPQLQDV